MESCMCILANDQKERIPVYLRIGNLEFKQYFYSSDGSSFASCCESCLSKEPGVTTWTDEKNHVMEVCGVCGKKGYHKLVCLLDMGSEYH